MRTLTLEERIARAWHVVQTARRTGDDHAADYWLRHIDTLLEAIAERDRQPA